MSNETPRTTRVLDDIVRIELSGWSDIGSGARTTNVWLIEGDTPALIGAGHPSNSRELIGALDELGLQASDIHRIICGSWAADTLGGVKAFPRADWFVTSTDMIQPRGWDTFSKQSRGRFLGVADEIFERIDAWGRSDLEPWLEEAFPLVSNHLDFVPIRSGQTVAASSVDLEVVAAPGPNPGHSLLWNPYRRLLFAFDVDLNGLPFGVDTARDYLVALERAAELNPRWLLTTHGDPSPRADWTLKRVSRHVNNYLSNVGPTMKGGKTVLDLVDNDLGYLPEHPAEYVEEVLRRRPFLDELVQSRMIKAEGEGLDRRYGTDVEELRITLE